MTSATASQSSPNVQHDFDGDARILNATFERRGELRRVLTALAQDLQKIEGRPTRIQAQIKLQFGDSDPKEHVYNVSINDLDFNAVEFARAVPSSEHRASTAAPKNAGTAGSPPPAMRSNGNGEVSMPVQSTPRSETRKADHVEDLGEIRPFKRPKTTDGDRERERASMQSTFHAHPTTPLTNSSSPEGTLLYLQDWHTEWLRQGGWLFDTLTKINHAMNVTKAELEKKLSAVQDILGQSMNTANASTFAELSSISKLVHWLEHCRKTSADKVQAREEKWRSSSATFHDQSRRDREAAEKRIDRKLEEQSQVLMKLARAQGIDVEGTEQASGASAERSREPSLGAQLTAELNNAGRPGGTEDEPFAVDD